jgi:hypothetical protein
MKFYAFTVAEIEDKIRALDSQRAHLLALLEQRQIEAAAEVQRAQRAIERAAA